MIATINPATNETLRIFKPLTDAELDERVENARVAFATYRRTSFPDRAQRMNRVADILEAKKTEYGRLMTTEMGKTFRSAVDEVSKCARTCRYYADHAERMLKPLDVATDARRSFVTYQPLGLILAVMPWNFPFWQVVRFAAPSLMVGNVVLLKHASNVPQCALAMESIFRDAGFDQGVFQTVLVGSDVIPRLVADTRVQAVTLTGSDAAGRSIAEAAGRSIKRCVLELGGSDPFIVLASANLDKAVGSAVAGRIINNGQSCIAAKRFIIAHEVADEFEERFVSAFKKLRIGDPLDDSTDIGPLATEKILHGLHDKVQRSVAGGARLLLGGQRLDRPGHYYCPTVLSNIPRGVPAYDEELFGPVASLFRVKNIDEAIAMANSTAFGLGSSVWTNNIKEQTQCIDEIESGMVFINSMVISDPRLPFGGVKLSGYGRELGEVGIREFANIKSISMA